MKPLKLKKLILEVHETSIFIILIFKTTDKNTIITHVRHVGHELVYKIFANITRLKIGFLTRVNPQPETRVFSAIFTTRNPGSFCRQPGLKKLEFSPQNLRLKS